MSASRADFEVSLRQARVRLHDTLMPSTLAASGVVASILVAVLWNTAPRAVLLTWLAGVLLTIAIRAAMREAHHREGTTQPRAAYWLGWHRAGFLLHALAWLAVVLLVPEIAAQDVDVLVFALAAVSAGALMATAFDLVAGLLFALPTALLALAIAYAAGDDSTHRLGVMMAAFVAIAVFGAQRAQRTMRESVRLRLADAESADEVRRSAERTAEALSQLSVQHRLMAQLLQNTRQGVCFADNAQRITDVNPAMCGFLGLPHAELVGRSLFDFLAPAEQERVRLDLQLHGGELATDFEMTITRPDGKQLPCVKHSSPLYDSQGERIGTVGLWTDLSARVEAESSMRRYKLAIDSITDLVSVTDEHEVYRLVNDAWCRATGVSREQALGRYARNVLPGSFSPERSESLRTAIATLQVQTARGRGGIADLADRLLETTYFPYAEDAAGRRCVAMVTRDITEQETSRIAVEAGAEYLRRTLNATGDAIFASDASDADESIRFINDQMLAMWDLPHDKPALTLASLAAFMAPQLPEPQSASDLVAEMTGQRPPPDSRVRLRDGRLLLRRCVAAAVGLRTIHVWSFRDVTVQDHAMRVVQENEAEQRALLEAFPGHICRLSRELVYTYVSKGLAALSGMTPAQMVGRSVRELQGATRESELRPLIERALAGETITYEHSPKVEAGRAAVELHVTIAAGVDRRSGAPSVFGFAIDTTQQKRAERALIAARDDAESANRAKTQFLSQMSHELRTPMNAILGFGQLLVSDPRQPLVAYQQAYVAEILRGAHHLLDLINEILDLGRIEAGQLQLEPEALALPEMLEQCLSLMRTLAESHDVQLQPLALPDRGSAGLRVTADRKRLLQVLLNLLGNAIKYNRPGGSVSVRCRQEGGHVRLAVEDNGRGLDAEEQRRLFQPFERLSAAHSAIEGTGIGLALSRRLVEAMGGTIGVDSQPGVGSTFWFYLPGAAAADAAPELPAKPPPAAATSVAAALHTVLYIEDNEVNVVLMEAMLARLPGVVLISAALPQEGLRLAQLERPALVLLDIQLPGMDGFEVLARLRAAADTRDTPVIAVSANALQSDIDAAMAAGFTGYLTKPLSLEGLLATVQRALPQTA